MNFSKIKSVYFLGIGGIGMSALARFFNSQNIPVYGYDKTPTPLTQELEAEGINIIYSHTEKALLTQIKDKNLYKSSTLVVLTPAIPSDHKGWAWLKNNGYTIYKRAKVLGIISENFYTLAVAGTHGKTTTSTLVAHILKNSGVDIIAFLGGVSSNYATNYIAPTGEYPFMVVEADEFDRSFLHLKPNDAIITSTDADHLDIYGKHESLQNSFIDFSKCLKPKGTLIVKKDIDIYGRFRKNKLSYSIYKKADFQAVNIHVKSGFFYFDLNVGTQVWKDIKIGLPGFHNVENAVAAIAMCL
ncbi:MAG: UDP-N-acetylmuramate--L-alanine ligase, partial [Bacteroidetes bacterium]|nr:UDP-N-acetylmuramate--L-alanine ligase [Bacteroidota bacterium]